jgi:hypothetical protein
VNRNPKRERRRLFRPRLRSLMLRCLKTKRRFVVEFTTSKTFHTKAQGREAHPGMTINTRRKPQRGFTGNRVKPRWGLVLRCFRDPGCAARPWALLLNRVAVRHTAQLQKARARDRTDFLACASGWCESLRLGRCENSSYAPYSPNYTATMLSKACPLAAAQVPCETLARMFAETMSSLSAFKKRRTPCAAT